MRLLCYCLSRLTKEQTLTNTGTPTPIRTLTTTYDAGGNVLTRAQQAGVGAVTTDSYSYSATNRDQLIQISRGTVHRRFTYDACGNPTRYKTPLTTSPVNMTWTRGRMLASYNVPLAGNTPAANMRFTYGAEGLRTVKRNNSTNAFTNYLWGGDRLAFRT